MIDTENLFMRIQSVKKKMEKEKPSCPVKALKLEAGIKRQLLTLKEELKAVKENIRK